MKPSSLLFSALASLVLGAALPREYDGHYDAIVVGGGPSGLSALSGLARVRRKALLIDSGEYRNHATRHMHDVLGSDGVTPAYFRDAARRQIKYYDTVSMTNGTVTRIEPAEDGTFTVAATIDGDEKTLSARRIILGTGMKDEVPDTPGLEENWEKGIYWCPWCDGHEHADQPLGLLAPLSKIPGLVREISTLNKDIIAFVNGTNTDAGRAATTTTEKGDSWVEFLQLNNVTVDNRIITEVRRLRDGGAQKHDPSLPTAPEYDLFELEFVTGRPVERAAFLTSFPDEQRSSLGKELGVDVDDDGKLAVTMTGTTAPEGMLTNVQGVYAVGDANSDGSTNVPHALWSGKRAAVAVHFALALDEEAEELKAAGKRVHGRSSLDPRDIWHDMNGKRHDVLYAGRFEGAV